MLQVTSITQMGIRARTVLPEKMGRIKLQLKNYMVLHVREIILGQVNIKTVITNIMVGTNYFHYKMLKGICIFTRHKPVITIFFNSKQEHSWLKYLGN